jgi:LPS sulfotransferase NodH
LTTLLDPRNGPDWDLPPPAWPPENYVIASVPRSGSTLLSRLLWDCGQAGAPSEYLNPMQLCDWERRFGGPRSRLLHSMLRGPLVGAFAGRWGWTLPRLQAHLDRVRWRRTRAGRFGLKLHMHHLCQHNGAAAPERLLGPCRWIRIQREDRLGQAISWARALQTGQWASWQAPIAPAVYSRAFIDRLLQRIDDDERAWDAIFATRPHLTLSFEALRAEPAVALRAVLEALGHPEPHAVPAPPLSLGAQADATSDQWRERYLSGR